MRKVILSIMVSLDGFFEGPNKDLDWHVWGESIEKHMYGVLNNEVDAILLGRVAYQLLADYWPTATDSIAPAMNKLPKIVFSKTLEKTDWQNSSIIRDNIGEEISRMKKQSGKDLILFGGAEIASTFMKLGLIDEYRLIVNPVILGKGNILFKDGTPKQNLEFVGAKNFTCGNVMLIHHPKKS